MQTFLTHVPVWVDFRTTASTLDYRRLGKQRVEGLQILNTLTGRSTGWRNHPAVRMWVGHEEVLAHYVMDICREWIGMGYKDTVMGKVKDMFPMLSYASQLVVPNWLTEDLVISHRSNLVRKFPEHYGPLWPTVPNDLPYVWPK